MALLVPQIHTLNQMYESGVTIAYFGQWQPIMKQLMKMILIRKKSQR